MSRDSAFGKNGEDKVNRYGWSDPGNPGKFAMIHKDQILIPEDSYQRAASGGGADQKVLRIASDFSWIAFQTISVCERGGAYYAVDGGHRLRAARRRSDIEMVPCMIYESDSVGDEAKAFDTVNSNRKPMSAVDRHQAHLVYHDELAVKAERRAQEAGRVISKNAGPGTISCVNDMKKFIKEDESVFCSVWPVVFELCDGEKLTHSVLGGLYYLEKFASEPPSSQRVKKKILSLGYHEIAKAAQSGAAYHGMRSPKYFADGILQSINKGFQKKVEI